MSAITRIQLKARAVIQRGAEVLLSFAIDPASGVRYGRFLGGAIEFGERAEDTIRRELREEIGVGLGTVLRLDVLEDICEWSGDLHHEITFMFEASFADPAVYRRDHFVVNESVCDGPAEWVAIERLISGEIPLYPPALRDLLHGLRIPTRTQGIPSNQV